MGIAKLNPHQRHGFTLFELLLTMAILAAVAATVIPHLGLMLADQSLVRAAEQMRIEMTQLRLESMRGGKVMMLEGVIEGSTLVAKPFATLSDAVEATDSPSSQASLLMGADQASAVVMPVQDVEATERPIELPENVSIESIAVVSSTRSLFLQQQSVGAGAAAPSASGSWMPILFYADGTTSTAAITLVHPQSGRIQVIMRGINGDISIGEVMQ